MKCEKISGLLVSCMDGRATARERGEVEAHLASCAACRERAEEFGRLWTVLDEAPVTQPSASFDARLRQRVAAEPRATFWSRLVPAPRLAFSLALLTLFSVWTIRNEPLPGTVPMTATQSEQEFRMIKDLGVLENYDVVTKFDALSDLPVSDNHQQTKQQTQTEEPNGQI